ncbi:hypothetical protein [Mariprofundus ferrinatatus]|uniref:hypothetical protein n=1 Tax=Mariprofundus ferrinatatus TaxID=1921087 RepID=UPI0018E26C67|nr:hypothetical protein [Mariprofundus ferrinatatus]
MREHLLPLADWIASRKQEKSLVIGINGAQGSGKSTIAGILSIILRESGYRVAVLSIDDLYLTHLERQKLSESVHPLFKTRGVPGTHDVDLGIETINRLKSWKGEVAIPRFDKGIDDRLPVDQWTYCRAPVDFILFEGWCVSTPPQTQDELVEPMNSLEAQEDKDGVWRRAVNDLLSKQYQKLFDMIDHLIFLQPPGFDCVVKWRSAQERRTFIDRQNDGMNTQQLIRFIQHYERLTRHSMEHLPELADVLLEIDHAQRVVCSTYRYGR